MGKRKKPRTKNEIEQAEERTLELEFEVKQRKIIIRQHDDYEYDDSLIIRLDSRYTYLVDMYYALVYYGWCKFPEFFFDAKYQDNILVWKYRSAGIHFDRTVLLRYIKRKLIESTGSVPSIPRIYLVGPLVMKHEDCMYFAEIDQYTRFGGFRLVTPVDIEVDYDASSMRINIEYKRPIARSMIDLRTLHPTDDVWIMPNGKIWHEVFVWLLLGKIARLIGSNRCESEQFAYSIFANPIKL